MTSPLLRGDKNNKINLAVPKKGRGTALAVEGFTSTKN